MMLRHGLVQVVCLWLCLAAHAESTEVRLPTGRWEAASQRLCVEIYRGGILELSQLQESDRNPARLAGPSRVRLTAPDEYEVTVDVRWILQKTLSSCRKYWYSKPLPQRDVLGLVARPHQPLVLVLRFSDERKRLQLCGAPGRCLSLRRAQPNGAPPLLDPSAEIQRLDAGEHPQEPKEPDSIPLR